MRGHYLMPDMKAMPLVRASFTDSLLYFGKDKTASDGLLFVIAAK